MTLLSGIDADAVVPYYFEGDTATVCCFVYGSNEQVKVRWSDGQNTDLDNVEGYTVHQGSVIQKTQVTVPPPPQILPILVKNQWYWE